MLVQRGLSDRFLYHEPSAVLGLRSTRCIVMICKQRPCSRCADKPGTAPPLDRCSEDRRVELIWRER